MSGCRAPQRDDAGFTLVELVVALMLFGMLAAAALPPILSSLDISRVTQLHTQAKNVTQERIEKMRNLEFHIDKQNGDFVDLLDMYFTRATSTGATTVTAGGEELVGRYVHSASASPLAPSTPHYETKITLSGSEGFTQYVYARFLDGSGQPIDASRFSTYDSQVETADQPPSLILGVTVVTEWVHAGETKRYNVDTRIADQRAQEPLVESVARGTALTVRSQTIRGGQKILLELRAGTAELDGSVSTASSTTGRVAAFTGSETEATPTEGSSVVFALPPALTDAATTSTDAALLPDWYAAGSVDAVPTITADVTSGLPNVTATSIPPTSLSYSASRGDVGTPRSDKVGIAMGGPPFVVASDPLSVRSSAQLSTPLDAASGTPSQARVETATGVVTLFPNSPVKKSDAAGLLQLSSSAQVVCSAAAMGGQLSSNYTVTMTWWGRTVQELEQFKNVTDEGYPSAPRRFQATWTWNGATLTPSGHAWEPDSTFVGDSYRTPQPVLFAELFPDMPATAPPDTGSVAGPRGFPGGVARLRTAPVYDFATTTLATAAIDVVLAEVVCVADDWR